MVSLSDSNCCSEPVSNTAAEEDCTGGLVTEVFDESDKIGADVRLHGCPQSCMPNLVEGLFECYEGILLVTRGCALLTVVDCHK